METQRARKKKRQTRNKKARRIPEEAGSDDNMDAESVTSITSSAVLSVMDDSVETDGEVVDYQDDLEGKLLENIDGATQKSAKGRQSCLMEVKNALSAKVLYDFVEDRRETLLDLVERTLKRGQKEDRSIAASLGCVLCIQLGEQGAASVFSTLKPHLITIIQDNTLPVSTRASCARALGICAFIGAEEMEDMNECLNALHGLLKKVPSNQADHVLLSSAVLAWGLLITEMSDVVLEDCLDEIWAVLHGLLEKGDLTLKIAAGEVVAVLHERSNALNEDFQKTSNGLSSLLRDLATESSRHIAKKDKRQQRSSFRDYLRAVENGDVPNDSIKFGSEEVELHSWARIRQYNAFKDILGSGVVSHLQENLMLRDKFDLGAPVVQNTRQTKESKWERQMMNNAAHKERTKSRNRVRENKRASAGL